MRARQIGKKNRSLTYWCTEKYAWKISSRRAPLGAVTRWKDARHTKIQLVLHQVGRRTTPERRIVGASTVKNVAVWWAGKALKIQIKWELLILNKNKEETGVIGSTATTRWYRSYRREMGGSSPPSPPKSFKFIQQFKCSSSVKIGCNYGEIAQRQSDGMKLEYRRLTRHSPTTSIIQLYFYGVKR